jgi:hypothetical protein
MAVCALLTDLRPDAGLGPRELTRIEPLDFPQPVIGLLCVGRHHSRPITFSPVGALLLEIGGASAWLCARSLRISDLTPVWVLESWPESSPSTSHSPSSDFSASSGTTAGQSPEGQMSQRMPLACVQLGAARSRQDEPKEVGEVGSKRETDVVLGVQ